MKLAFYKVNTYYTKIEICVFDDDLVKSICDAIWDVLYWDVSYRNNPSELGKIDYDYGINLGIPRTIRVDTAFVNTDEKWFWKCVENKLLTKDIVLKRNDIFYY